MLLIASLVHPAAAGTTPVVVQPGNRLGVCSEGCWIPYDGTSRNGRWVTGPETPPLGLGSAYLKASTGDALELGYSTDTAPDLATFVGSYSSYSRSGGTYPAFEILTNAYLGAGKYQVLIYAAGYGSRWTSFDATSSGGWQWDCNGDGNPDGGGTITDFLTDCNASAKVNAIALVAVVGNTYVDNVELGPDGATTVFDMEPPSITIADKSKIEGDTGRSRMTFSLRLSGPNDVAIDIHYRTADGTAVAGKDYVARNGTLTIPAGFIYPRIRVPLFGDTLVEADETVQLRLHGVTNGEYGDRLATGTILDND